MRFKRGVVYPGHAEEAIALVYDRLAAERRYTAIGHALVVHKFIGQTDPPAAAKIGRDIGISPHIALRCRNRGDCRAAHRSR